jgi:putative ABC transport system ATP-binding protein
VVEDRINPTILSAREALDKLPKNED